jgi:hypothetical protein
MEEIEFKQDSKNKQALAGSPRLRVYYAFGRPQLNAFRQPLD